MDGARTVIQTEQNSQRVVVAGVCFWIGASFQFGLFNLPSLNPVLATLLKSAVTTGGFAAIAMILYLELTSPKRMRFTSRLDIEALADLYEFIARFAASQGLEYCDEGQAERSRRGDPPDAIPDGPGGERGRPG